MTVPFLDLRRAVVAQRGELEAALADVMDGGRFVLGSHVERFESAFAAWCGSRHAVGVASGTDALALALRAVGVEPGHEVITSAATCVPTVAGIEATGARPVLVDIEPERRTLDPALLPAAITDRTRAVVPVHLYGRCADMEPIVEIAHAHGLAVVEDAAQAHGAEYRGRRAGSLADAAAFSFYPTKNLAALGDAGAVMTDDREVAARVRRLRSYGESERHWSVDVGANSRLDELQAAVLLVRLALLDEHNARRQALAERYRCALADSSATLPAQQIDGRESFHLYVVRVDDRDRFRTRLAAAGVNTLVHYPRAVHEHPAYRHLAANADLPHSEALMREAVSLPLYPQLTDGEFERVVDAVQCASV